MFDLLFSISVTLIYFFAFKPSIALADVYDGDGVDEWLTKGGPLVDYETPEGYEMRMPENSRIAQSYNSLAAAERPLQPKAPPAPARRQGAQWSSPYAQAYQALEEYDAAYRRSPKPARAASTYAQDDSYAPRSSETDFYAMFPPSGQPEYEPYQGPVTFAELLAPPPQEYPQDIGSPVEGLSLDEYSLVCRQFLATRRANQDGVYSRADYDAAYRYALEYAQRKRAGDEEGLAALERGLAQRRPRLQRSGRIAPDPRRLQRSGRIPPSPAPPPLQRSPRIAPSPAPPPLQRSPRIAPAPALVKPLKRTGMIQSVSDEYYDADDDGQHWDPEPEYWSTYARDV